MGNVEKEPSEKAVSVEESTALHIMAVTLARR